MKPNLVIRRSARDELCTFNIAGVCNYDRATTVLCHLHDGEGGMGLKAGLDLSGAYGCSDCHSVIDGARRHAFEPGERDFYCRRANARTINRLVVRGIIQIVPGAL